ncbi:hypothetical protein KJ865_06345, partial [Myxococcota bacterium]|nr:hypothetical protein [Myxococcota bacterium]
NCDTIVDAGVCQANASCFDDGGAQTATCECDSGYVEIPAEPGVCHEAQQPLVGELVITEVMIEPTHATSVLDGQYFEMFNTLDATMDLSDVGFYVTDGTLDATSEVGVPTLMGPKERWVVGANATFADNGNLVVDHEFTAMIELNTVGSGIEIYRVSDDAVLDDILWDATWNHASGASLSLSPGAADADISTLNDDGAHWCHTRFTTYGLGDHGTPGNGNDHCLVQWCNTQSPASTTTDPNVATENIYGQVYEPGNTNVAGQGSFITAQLGYGGDGTAADETWTWVAATYNVDVGNNDEYMQTLTVATAGDYDYAYRMSMDGGLSHVYCDTNGTHGYSGADTYAPADNGDLTVNTPPTWTKLVGGWFHTCGIKSDDTLWCWGRNSDGQLGDGSFVQKNVPSQVAGMWANVWLGSYHSCGMKLDSTLWCWGNNGTGELGNGTTTKSEVPVEVLPIAGHAWVTAGVGYGTSCAINDIQELWCWGQDYAGKLGTGGGGTSLVPVQPNAVGINTWKSVPPGGEDYTCAIQTDDTVWCAGENNNGQYGNGTTSSSNILVQTTGNFVSATKGINHVCGVKSDDTVHCWGQNSNGQVGNGGGGDQLLPVQISLGYDMISARGYHTCALDAGDIVCWGYNNRGQLGDGTTTDSFVPKTIVSGYVFVSSGGFHTCGIQADGTAWCWGNNDYGELGDNSTTERHVPVQVQ